MKNIIKLSVILILLANNVLFAQSDTSGWGRNSVYSRKYDPHTYTKIKGEIIKVDKIVHSKGMSVGIHIQLKSDDGEHSIHLGPKWYLDKQSVQLKVKDQVDVKGSEVILDGSKVIIAQEIIRGKDILKLRDMDGIPMWAGRGRR